MDYELITLSANTDDLLPHISLVIAPKTWIRAKSEELSAPDTNFINTTMPPNQPKRWIILFMELNHAAPSQDFDVYSIFKPPILTNVVLL